MATPTAAPAGTSDVIFVVHSDDVLAMIQAVELALSPMMLVDFMNDEVELYFADRVSERFSSEGDDVVGKWVPLAAVTQEIRSSMGYGASSPINVRTGNMYQYLLDSGVAVPVPGGAMYTTPGRPAQGELAGKMEHAQMGGVSDSGKPYPARPVLGMNLSDLGAVMLLLQKHIERGGSLVI